MEEKDIFSALVDEMTAKPYSFTIAINTPVKPKYSIWDRLLRKPYPEVETQREIIIKPCVVANMYRIAGRAVQLPDLDSLENIDLNLITKYMPDMLYIIAAGIQNNEHEPDKNLIRFIELNFNQEQIFGALYKSIQGVGLKTFMNSIALVRGTVEILNPASPQDGSE